MSAFDRLLYTREITETDCLLRGLRDRARAEGFNNVDAIALADLAAYAVALFDRGEVRRCAAVTVLRNMEAAGRRALESEAGQ